MNTEALDLWNRAKKALSAAQTIVYEDPDSSASRSYYPFGKLRDNNA